MAQIFDTHAHYDDTAFDADRDMVLAGLPATGVGAVVNAAVDPASARQGIALAEKYAYVYAAAGVHPEEAARATDDWLGAVAQCLRHPKVRAVGEIGLDYHYEDGCPRPIQLEWFRRQLALAVEYGLPVIVHDRDAHADTLELLSEYRPQGVVHCFSGSVEMMRQIVSLGMYIGLGGAVTFKNARRAVEVAEAVPADRLLLETDAPYMAPEPHRGKRCHSGLIADTAARIAAIRGVTTDELLDVTYTNACRLFGIR